MKKFKVLDLRVNDTVAAKIVEAATPEQAVLLTLGVQVVRGSSRYIQPIARVYWQDSPETTNMVRLYPRIHESKPAPQPDA